MRNPPLVVREMYAQCKHLVTRHTRAFIGFVLIIVISALSIAMMVYALVREMKSVGIRNQKGDGNGTDIDNGGNINKRGVAIVNSASSTTGFGSQWDHHNARQNVDVQSIATEIVTATTTIYITLTRDSSSTSTTLPSKTTIKLSTTSAPKTSSGSSTTTAPDSTQTDAPGVMSGWMFCPATDRSDLVYTPCAYVHTNQAGMVDVTSAIPGIPIHTVASSAAKPRPRPYNPFPAMQRELSNWIEANKELAWRLRRLSKLLVKVVRIKTAEFVHPHPNGVAQSNTACIEKDERPGVVALRRQIEALDQQNVRLRDGIYNAQEVVEMQQELLDVHLGIIQKQRAQIEEATRFQLWWAHTHNQTGQYKAGPQTGQYRFGGSGAESTKSKSCDHRGREEMLKSMEREDYMCI